jgi:hypothetical protein
MSILSVCILVFIAANASAQQKIVRKELYKANIGTQDLDGRCAGGRFSAKADDGTAIGIPVR